MKAKVQLGARYLLGLIYFLSGVAGLFNLVSPPAVMPEKLMSFMNGMMSATYFFPLLKGTETVCGLLLLVGFASPLALVILAPISINIFLVHLFLTPGLENIVVPLVILILHGVAALRYWSIYQPLFGRK